MSDAPRFLAVAGRGERLRPSWWNTRYHALRQLTRVLEKLIADPALPAGETILDYGCAEKPYESLFAGKFRRYLGADLPGNPHADVELAGDGRLPLDDGSVDAVLSSQVLEHVAEPPRYLGEARRVLKDGGHLILSTHGTWPYHPDPDDYWRWTRDGLTLELGRAGFEVLAVRGILGRMATALQLLQDSVTAPLPRRLRPVPGFFFQRAIGGVEWARRGESVDAAAFIALCRRR